MKTEWTYKTVRITDRAKHQLRRLQEKRRADLGRAVSCVELLSELVRSEYERAFPDEPGDKAA